MGEAFKEGGCATDVLTGKAVKIGSVYADLNASGGCIKINGADYQVTAGKTFYPVGAVILKQANAGAVGMRYADNAALTTNPVAMDFNPPGIVVAPGNYTKPVSIFNTSAPAGKYVGMYAAGNVGVITIYFMGYEV